MRLLIWIVISLAQWPWDAFQRHVLGHVDDFFIDGRKGTSDVSNMLAEGFKVH